VTVCATKEAWPASGSVTVRVPPVERVVSSVTEPVAVPPITAPSLVPLIVMVMVCAVPSAVWTVMVRVTVSPVRRAWTSACALSRV
jgi:hypothetical protein